MTDDQDTYAATLDELVDNFRAALLAMVPVVDRAKINYRDTETHRDWERLAESMFDAFVRSPILADEGATGHELPLARYDIDLEDYLAVSWLTSDLESPYRGAVVRFLTRDAPFDRIQVVDIDPVTLRVDTRRIIALSDFRPALYRRTEGGEAVVVTQIVAVE